MMTPTKTQSAAEAVKPRQEGMTYSDSMDIVTPMIAARTRVMTSREPVPVVDDEVSPQGKRRRRWALLLLILLLLLPVSFWLGRITVLPQVPTVALVHVMVPAPKPAMAPPPASTPAPVVAAKPDVTAPPAASATIATSAVEPDTKLLQVSVGTGSRGGLTLMFDRAVDWTTQSPAEGHAELDVEGVHALGTFPRNLPLPPGVKSIHAVISAAGGLNLQFDLKPGVQAYTFPGKGPTAAVNVYFRRPIEEVAAGDTMRAGPNGIPTGLGGCGGTNLASVKAVTLLQQSLDKNPAYAPVRTALTVLMTCNGNSRRAEQVAAGGSAPGNVVKLAVVDAALLYARGDATGAVQVLKSNAPSKADHGYDELMADLTAAAE